ncbi:MAG: tetratricopeptide repeat protein [Verrucomicrobia bacterium]|nr:tetratricopeptide repeat protein [Verrucomicrobiota bacterium]
MSSSSDTRHPALDVENPWPGLATFTEDQAALFHGRDAEIRELSRRGERNALTVLFGQSGLGKSSLLQAGVFPRLRAAGFCPVYLRLDHGPGAPTPGEQVKSMVAAETARHGTWTKAGAAQPGESLWEFFHHRDDRLVGGTGRTIVPVLVFDQFEELFTLGAGAGGGAERTRAVAFMSELAELVENRPSEKLVARLEESSAEMDAFDFGRTDYRVVITLREDYLPHLESLKTIMPALMENRMRLARMTGTQALEAVAKPGGSLVTAEVARAIVEFVAGARGGSVERLAELDVEPPLLSVICRELNERRRAAGQAQITADLVTGNRREILTDFYERSMSDLPAPMRTFVEDHLLTKSGFRDNLSLESALDFPGVTRPLIDTLVNRRLLRTEDRLGVERVELTHDVLAEVIRASRDERQQRDALQTEERRRREAEEALARAEAEKSAARRSLWRTRMMLAACAVLALAAGFALWETRRARARAERLATIAEESRVVAVAAQAVTAHAREQAESVLGFSLTDLREQLEDYGHLPLMWQVAEQAVAYYEGLPQGLDSPNLRAGHARALAVMASILSWQGEFERSRVPQEKAFAIFEGLDRTGALTPVMRVDYGYALTSAVGTMTNQRLYLEAVPYAERAETVLQPALADPQQGGLAQRQLAWTLFSHGWALARGAGRATQAVPFLEQAMANAREADGKAPLPRLPGLQAASMGWMLSETLWNSGRSNESREINNRARLELRAMLKQEPFLFVAKDALALCNYMVVTQSSADWDYPRCEEALDEEQRLYLELLKYDPKNVARRGVYGVTWTAWRRSMALRNRDYAEAEKNILTGLPYLAEEPTNDRNFARARTAMTHLAQIYATTGRDAEADEALAKAEKFSELADQKRSTDTTAYALSNAGRTGMRRSVEIERLNWSLVRKIAEETLAKLAVLTSLTPADYQSRGGMENDLCLDLAWAAFHQGDYATARRTIVRATNVPANITPPNASATMQSRFGVSGNQLFKCQVFHRAGEADAARKRLAALWPEMEAVFARAPDAINNQLRFAWALWIRSEIEAGADATARRALLERAAGYLRPAAAAGKLSRWEREVLLPEVEAGLAGKPAFVPAGRLVEDDFAALRERADALRDAGNYIAAEPIERQVLALVIQEQGEQSRQVPGRQVVLAEILLKLGKVEEAEALARTALAAREKNSLPGDEAIAFSQHNLGLVLVAQKRYAEAEPLLIAAGERMRLQSTRASLRAGQKKLLAEAAASLVELYQATGRPAKAEEWKKILATIPDYAAPPPAR